MTEDEMVGWLDGWMASPTQWTCIWATLGVSDGKGSLACCSPWGQTQLSELIEIQKKK